MLCHVRLAELLAGFPSLPGPFPVSSQLGEEEGGGGAPTEALYWVRLFLIATGDGLVFTRLHHPLAGLP